MASNALVKPNAGGLLLLAGAADSLAARRDDAAINDFRVSTVQKLNHSDFCFTVCHAPLIITLRFLQIIMRYTSQLP
jgi:hypothetical protein